MEIYTPKQARQLANLTQKEMSIFLGLSENAYILKECGKRRFYVDEAIPFARKCGIPIERINFCLKHPEKWDKTD